MVFLPSTPPKPVVVKERVELTKNDKYKHVFRCFCGRKFIAIGADVTIGRTKSCGCWHSFMAGIKRIKHNASHLSEYGAWGEMKRRCYDKRRLGYENYGGRGIIVCSHWLASYSNFIADMGLKPGPEYSLDRIDNNGNYEPDNCRWTTRVIQNRNQRGHKDKQWDLPA